MNYFSQLESAQAFDIALNFRLFGKKLQL